MGEVIRKGFYLVTGLACLMAAPTSMAFEADWQPAKQKDGVTVHTAQMPGYKFLAFKAHVVVQGSVEEVLREITDHEHYADWYFNCETVELLERISEDEALVRVEIKTPFPMANRDAVNRVTAERDGDSAIVYMHSQPDLSPEVDGLVRMRTAVGSWHLQPQEGGVSVTHYYHADPLVDAPGWIVNRFVVGGPISSLSNLRERMAQKALQEKKVGNHSTR